MKKSEKEIINEIGEEIIKPLSDIILKRHPLLEAELISKNLKNVKISSLFLGLIQISVLSNTSLLEIKKQIYDSNYLKKIIEKIEIEIEIEKDIFKKEINKYIVEEIDLKKENEEINRMNFEEANILVEKIIIYFEKKFKNIFEKNNKEGINELNQDGQIRFVQKIFHHNYHKKELKLILVSGNGGDLISEEDHNEYSHFLQGASPLFNQVLLNLAFNNQISKETFFLFYIIQLLEMQRINKNSECENLLFNPSFHIRLGDKLESENGFKKEKRITEDYIWEHYVSKITFEEAMNKIEAGENKNKLNIIENSIHLFFKNEK